LVAAAFFVRPRDAWAKAAGGVHRRRAIRAGDQLLMRLAWRVKVERERALGAVETV
jgi:hypothetical protein